MTPLQFLNDDEREDNMEGNGDNEEINLGDDEPLFPSFPRTSSCKRKKSKDISNNRSTKTTSSYLEEKLEVVLDDLSTKSTQSFPLTTPTPILSNYMNIVVTFPGFNEGSTQYLQALLVFVKKQNREAFMFPATNDAKMEFLKLLKKN
ncbi:unnamed protein product [Lactuca saligna]|uniref:Uncharacterized protein n=1 Tax=Lactuca saligna TaxID=75948 RepID=A0AA36EF86_LACSI|nr:unnamed protein product [Lactuca saligna]